MVKSALIIDQPAAAMSIQGRPFRNMRHEGVPLAGPADPVACAMANWLAGNPAGSPALEWAMSGFSSHVSSDMALGISGATGSITINGQPHNPYETLILRADDHVQVSPSRHGARLYLAVNGGFAVNTILGATSTYLPAHIGTAATWRMQKGDALPVRPALRPPSQRILPDRCRQNFSASHMLRYAPCDEDRLRTSTTIGTLSWRVTSRFDRAAVQLKPDENTQSQQIMDTATPSNAVFPGTIQLPPDGQPLLMGVDSRTTGGYTIVGQIIRADRHLLGQMRGGDAVRLFATSTAEAQEIYRQKLNLWRRYLPDLRLD